MFETPAGIGPLDHIGVVVPDVEAALPFWRDVLRLPVHPAEDLPHMGLRVAKVTIGESRLELVQPLEPGTAIAGFLQKRGPGLHHVCFRVADVAAAGRRLAAQGYRPLTDAPQPGADGCLVLFLHPKQTGGVLVELSQPPARPA
jgi:methylmalonyl-CoA/ethylmalonyl-CoA epimerase